MVVCYKSALVPMTLSFGSAGLCGVEASLVVRRKRRQIDLPAADVVGVANFAFPLDYRQFGLGNAHSIV